MRETLVFLPEMMCDARLFGPQLAEFSQEWAVMVAPVTLGERIEEIASNLLDLMPPNMALLGQGMGAAVALEIMRRAPNRVQRAAFINAPVFAETPQQAAERDPNIARVKAGKFETVISEEFPASRMADGPFQDEILALIAHMADELGPEVYFNQSRAMQRRRDQQSTLRKVTMPVQIICGLQDPASPLKRHEFLAELAPTAELSVIEHAGFMPTLEAPEAMSDILRAWFKRR